MPAAISAVEIGRKTPPTTPPSNSRNFIDYPPPSKSGRKTPPTTPPRIQGTSSTTPTLEIGPENYRPLLLDDQDPPLLAAQLALTL